MKKVNYVEKRRRDADEDDNDAVEVISPVVNRRPLRVRVDLRSVFRTLKAGNVEEFLGSWIIRQRFAAAFTLIGSFGQGHRIEDVRNLWVMRFQNNLFIRSLQSYRTKGHCCACGLGRQLKYCFYRFNDEIANEGAFKSVDDDSDGEFELLGIMGTHCYEIKFIRLMRLASVCINLANNHVEAADFEEIFHLRTAKILSSIETAQADMRKAYN